MHEQLTLFEIHRKESHYSQLDNRAVRLLDVLWEMAEEIDGELPRARVAKRDLLDLTHMTAQQFTVAIADLQRAGLIRVTHTIPGRELGTVRRANTYYFTREAVVLMGEVAPGSRRKREAAAEHSSPASTGPKVLAYMQRGTA
jgi:hypothetical protein